MRVLGHDVIRAGFHGGCQKHIVGFVACYCRDAFVHTGQCARMAFQHLMTASISGAGQGVILPHIGIGQHALKFSQCFGAMNNSKRRARHA